MKKIFFIFYFLFLICSASFAQITFDKGYFISKSKQKTECLIRNHDWVNSPKKIEYKLSATDEQVQIEEIENIDELVIYDYCKYIKATVKIDRATDRLNDLEADGNPVWKEETLFLKVLIEGEASLYAYYEKSLKRFFYRIANNSIQQLVYKLYQPENISLKKYLVNAQFRQQLRVDLPCTAMTDAEFQQLSYSEKSIKTYFLDYYKCTSKDFTDWTPKNPKEYWHFNLVAGVNSTSLSYSETRPTPTTFDFGSQLSAAIGFETEFIIPYTNKKLNILLSPNLQILKGSTTFNTRVLNFNFYSVAIPVGFRYYQPITSEIKAFVNLAYVFELPLNGYVERNSVLSYQILVKEPSFSNKLSFGGGVFYKKWGGEFRYYGNRSILGYNSELTSNFSKVSFLLAYRLF